MINMNKEEFLVALSKEGLLIYGTTWLENFKRLKELKKYKEMWEEFKEKLEPGTPIELPHSDLTKFGVWDIIDFMIKNLEQKYFPPVKKYITIEVEAENEREVDAGMEDIKELVDNMGCPKMKIANSWSENV